MRVEAGRVGEAVDGFLADHDVVPLLEILGAKRLVESDCEFVPVQNIQANGATTLLAGNAGHFREKSLPDASATKRNAHEQVLQEHAETSPRGIAREEDGIPSGLAAVFDFGKDRAEFGFRAKAILKKMLFPDHGIRCVLVFCQL